MIHMNELKKIKREKNYNPTFKKCMSVLTQVNIHFTITIDSNFFNNNKKLSQ